MNDSGSLSHDLFLLMLNLSQLRDPDHIVQLFVEAINSRELGVAVQKIDGTPNWDSATEELATRHYRFGHILFDGDTASLPPDTMPLLRNAVRMLAIILENRRRAQQQEQNQEERHSLLLAAAMDGFWMLNLYGNILEVNDAYCEMIGYSRAELLSMNVTDLDTNETPEETRSHIQQIQDNSSHRFEAQHTRKDGTIIDVEVSASYLDHLGGRIIAFFRDITDRKKIEQDLRNRRRFLDRVIDQSPFPTWISDANGTFLRGNPALFKLLNLTHEQLAGKYNVLEDPQVANQGLREPFLTAYKEGKTVDFSCTWDGHDIPTLDLDGSTFVDIEGTIFPIIEENGEVTNAVITYKEVSDRNLALRELNKLQAFLANIIDSMPSALVGVDPEGKVTQWNAQAESMTGVTTQDAMGRQLDAVFPRMAVEMDRIRTAMQERRVQKDPNASYQQDGQTKYEDVTIFPLVANGVEGAVIRVDDVTDRVSIQEMIIQSEKMHSVGGLAAGVAHEINNPLGGIVQAAQNIQRRISHELPQNEEAAARCGTTLQAIRNYLEEREVISFLDGIRSCGARASSIVSNMLQFARRSESTKIESNIVEIIDHAVDLAGTDFDLKKRYDFRHMKIVREFEPNIPRLQLIPMEVEQVFLNLLKNAAQAMHGVPDAQPPQLTLRAFRDGHHIQVEIEDNGPGIPDDIKRRIFEPFFTTKPVGIGTGLGLSICYMIITNNHQGEMTAESTPGQGTKFIIRLPLPNE